MMRMDATLMRLPSMARIRGATTVELLYMLPVFFILTFAIIETAFVFRMRSTLNVASFQAARTGAMQHALLAQTENKLARGMMPLYMKGSTSPAAYAEALITTNAMLAVLKSTAEPVRIISPTRTTFEAFRETRRLAIPGDGVMRNRQVMANDNLRWRPTTTRNVVIDGRTLPINIQDANIFKISTFWCYQLKTPLLDRLVNRVVSGVSGLGGSREQRACNVVGQMRGGYYLAVTSQATVRMQSDVVLHDNNLR